MNTFTGPITNNAGILSLNSASTYAGTVVVNAGTVQMTTTPVIQGGTTVASNAVLSIVQLGSATMTLGNLTFNGVAAGSFPTLGLTPNTANNPNVALVNCGTLTLNGTNTISLAAVNVGTLALIHYTGTPAGSGNITNLSLPQGATGFISNSAAASTVYQDPSDFEANLVSAPAHFGQDLSLPAWAQKRNTRFILSWMR